MGQIAVVILPAIPETIDNTPEIGSNIIKTSSMYNAFKFVSTGYHHRLSYTTAY